MTEWETISWMVEDKLPTGSVHFVFKPISERQVDKYITSIGKKKQLAWTIFPQKFSTLF